MGNDTDETFNIRFSARELMYLKNTSFLPEPLVQILLAAEPTYKGAAIASVSRDVAEQFRDEFTLQLAAVGFDANDEPTAEGRLLEDLIDRFFLE